VWKSGFLDGVPIDLPLAEFSLRANLEILDHVAPPLHIMIPDSGYKSAD
jgi:hypothetical protein